MYLTPYKRMDYQGLAFPLNIYGAISGSIKVSYIISLAYSFPAISSKLMLYCLVIIHPITHYVHTEILIFKLTFQLLLEFFVILV
jgi:hypothetical protein